MKNRGSVTVEASIIVTTALLLTFFVFFTAVYFYDVHRLQTIATKKAVETWSEIAMHSTADGVDWEAWAEESLLWRATGDFSTQEEKVLGELKSESSGLWFGNTCDYAVSVSADSVCITYEGVYYFPIRTGFGADGSLSFAGGVSYSRTESEEWVRIIGGIVKGLGGKESGDD